MKTILVVFCAVVGIACAAETGRTYDNDNQHKRSSQDKSSRQVVGYEEIETTSDFWRQKAQSILQGKLAEAKITKNPKNVIYFIGDGMSPQTVAATRVYLGNENRMLSFEEFPYTGTARTYCVNRQVADSACTATAYLSGVKTNYGMINVAAEVPRYNCTYNREETEFLGLLKWAQDNEMATGVVSNARITHATPAGTYASIANRDWEDDSYMARDECDTSKYPDIAQQLIHGEVGKRFDVILGGGRRHFVPSGFMDNENVGGSRADGKNLINEWLELHGSSSKYVWNKAELQAVDPSKTDRLLGLFDSSHCLYNLEIDEKKLQDTKPKLTEMVEAAIKFLNKRESGYVLFVEGGKIDMAHHETHPRLALEETAEYSRAIDLARKMTSVEDTLIVVTADHSHTMTYNGYTQAQSTIRAKLDKEHNTNKAKNVIFFIADGMSVPTIAATRMYLGNENKMLSFDEFPYSALAKTYCLVEQVPGSACTATAYLSGVKTNIGLINVAPFVPRHSCEYNRTEAEFTGLLKWAQDSGMATGVVTTARATHATPAGAYASVTERDWEHDGKVRERGCDPTKYPDIGQQLVHGEVGKNINVVLAGGRRFLLPTTAIDEEGKAGSRTDGRDLISEWKELHGSDGKYVWNKRELLATDTGKIKHLLGLFESDHCLYNHEIDEGRLQDMEPKLTEMVDSAIKMLKGASDAGYVLFVEGGRVDMAHHDTRARMALEETAEFSRAIELARKMTSEDDTLIVVSADHSHTMTYNGYPKRGNDILGIADVSDRDNLPYTTLSYANGEGYYSTYKKDNLAEREDISGYDYTDYHTQYPATVPLSSETHGGEDVTVYASGPMAHLFTGNIEQNVIPDLIAYAAQIGRYKVEKDDDDEPGAGSSLVVCVQLAIACLIAAIAGWIKV
ncbi:hypothetical protein pipiens_005482 [Culex pipiens pipiens]|uniref:Alkaline phosphatase n=2 Tax=Culex pipiens TaxID=7175 RepID=A0ABD1DX36_CULPP